MVSNTPLATWSWMSPTGSVVGDGVVSDKDGDDNTTKRFATGGGDELVIRVGNVVSLHTRNVILREMQVHFIPIKVSVVSATIGVMHADRALPGQHAGLVRHHRRLVQGGLTIHEQDITSLQMPEHLLDTNALLLGGALLEVVVDAGGEQGFA